MWVKLAAAATLSTPRLLLRPLTYADAQAVYHLTADSDTARFALGDFVDYEQMLTYLVTDWLREPLGKWALVDRESQELLGLIRLEQLVPSKKRTEIRYLLRKESRGRGVMAEALEAVLAVCFHSLDLDCVTVHIHLENQASQQVAKRAGFQIVKRFKGSDRHSHQLCTYLTYELTASIYRSTRKKETTTDDNHKIST